MKSSILKELEVFNIPEFKFDPIKHRYTLDGDEFISVTTFIQRFHKQFEENYWSQRKADEAGIPPGHGYEPGDG